LESHAVTRYQEAKSVVAVSILEEIDLYGKPKSLQERMQAILTEINKDRLQETEINNAKIHNDDRENQ